MAKVIGVVQDIRSRTTSYGEMYDVVVDGNSYGNGKYSPRGITTGDTVEFDVEIKGNFKNIAPRSLRKVDPSRVPQQSAQSIEQKVRSMPPSDAQKQQIISRQAALNTAVAHVSAMLRAECVPLPNKVADRMSYVNSLVLAFASGFHNISVGSPITYPADVLNVEVLSSKKASTTRAGREAVATPEDDHVEGPEPGDEIPF